MPKFEYFTLTFHVSRQTVGTALELLSRDGLVHKEGRSWIVGPQPRRDSIISGDPAIETRPAVLLLISSSQEAWFTSWLNRETIYRPFGRSAERELQRYGMQIITACASVKGVDTAFVRGRSEIEQVVRQLGERYAGALHYGLTESSATEWKDIIRWLIRLKKPIVSLGIDLGTTFTRINDFNSPKYAYCIFDEAAAVDLAAGTLNRLGHRVIGVLEPSSDAPGWIARRWALLRHAASQYGMTVVSVMEKEDYWHRLEWRTEESAFERFIEKMVGIEEQKPRGAVQPAVVSREEALDRAAPSLAELASDRRVTAIVAPNDLLARLYWRWLRMKGLRIPQDVSLIGFDNDVQGQYYPLSTIDFDFDTLGYRAAHFLISDIQIRTLRDGWIRTDARLVDRGSVAPPGRLRNG